MELKKRRKRKKRGNEKKKNVKEETEVVAPAHTTVIERQEKDQDLETATTKEDKEINLIPTVAPTQETAD